MLGGMGMGGGTVLIPVLTIFLGVSQHVAQATNVIAFLPMAAFALPRHKKSGYLRSDGLALVIIPALISSVIFSFLATIVGGDALRQLFGAFLVALAVRGALSLKDDIVARKKGKTKSSSAE